MISTALIVILVCDTNEFIVDAVKLSLVLLDIFLVRVGGSAQLLFHQFHADRTRLRDVGRFAGNLERAPCDAWRDEHYLIFSHEYDIEEKKTRHALMKGQATEDRHHRGLVDDDSSSSSSLLCALRYR